MTRMTTVLITALLALGVNAAERQGPPPEDAAVERLVEVLEERPAGGYGEEALETLFTAGIVERNGERRMLDILEMLHEDIAEGGPIGIAAIMLREGGVDTILEGQHGAVRFSLDLAADDGYLIDGLVVEPAGGGGGPELMVPQMDPADFGAEIADMVQQLHADGFFSGAVLVLRDGEVVYEGAVGLADMESGRENTVNTPFNLGSMNKMFTGVAIAQLVEQGLLDFDTTVGEVLPDFPLEAARSATVDQLLTHTAGLGDYFGPAFFGPEGAESPKDLVRDLEGLLPFVVEGGMIAEPGEMNRYSNSGPVVLGLMLEALTGQSYYDYVQEHIYDVAGMDDAGSYSHDDEAEAGYAIGYHRETMDDPWQPDRGWHPYIGSPAGGGYASVWDMAAFGQALMDGALLSPEMRDHIWIPRAEMSVDFGYAYLFGRPCWGDDRTGEEQVICAVGHNGGAPGVNADYKLYPELGYQVVVLANRSRQAIPLADWLAELIAQNHMRLMREG